MTRKQDTAMVKASKRFKRRSMRLTKAEQSRLYCPLTTVLLDIRLPVAMQLAFEAGWRECESRRLLASKRVNKKKVVADFLAGKRSSKGIEDVIRKYTKPKRARKDRP